MHRVIIGWSVARSTHDRSPTMVSRKKTMPSEAWPAGDYNRPTRSYENSYEFAVPAVRGIKLIPDRRKRVIMMQQKQWQRNESHGREKSYIG